MILITGGAGFIGSHVVAWCRTHHPEWRLLVLDQLTYAGHLPYIESYLDERCLFVQGRIEDSLLLAHLFETHDIRHVIHLAAESHVDNAIAGPAVFVTTNVQGTFCLLEAARSHWMVSPHQPKPGYESSRFHHVSTDEVYGALSSTGYFTEMSPYQPNSPYSATKAASDFLVRAAYHTYGLNVVTTNCSNNYGPHQHDEKLIPTVVRCAQAWQPIPLYGNGHQVRDWLYVGDHAAAIGLVFQQGQAGETTLIGARNEWANHALIQKICEQLDDLYPHPNGSYRTLVTHVSDRPGHDWRYAIDPSKLETQLGWRARMPFEEGLRQTIEWLWEKKR